MSAVTRCVRLVFGVLVIAGVALSVAPASYAATTIATGYGHTCVVKADGSPVCWGSNGWEQTMIPPAIGAVTQITAGYDSHVRGQGRRHCRLLGQ